MSRKTDLFASNSHYAFGAMGLNHYRVSEDRAHMGELVSRAESMPYTKEIIEEDVLGDNYGE